MPDKTTDAEKGVIADVLKDSPEGSQATAQSDQSQSHSHSKDDTGPLHNDATAGTKQSDGSVTYEKLHSDD